MKRYTLVSQNSIAQQYGILLNLIKCYRCNCFVYIVSIINVLNRTIFCSSVLYCIQYSSILLCNLYCIKLSLILKYFRFLYRVVFYRIISDCNISLKMKYYRFRFVYHIVFCICIRIIFYTIISYHVVSYRIVSYSMQVIA